LVEEFNFGSYRSNVLHETHIELLWFSEKEKGSSYKKLVLNVQYTSC